MLTEQRDFDRILVIALSGFGDTVMSIPLCRALRQRYPAAKITALTLWPTSGQVLSSVNLFDRVMSHNFLDEPLRKSIRFVWQLRQEQFDLGVLIFPSNRVHYNLLTWLIHPRMRLGHAYQAGNSLTYGRFLLTYRVSQEKGMHCVEQNMQLAYRLGYSGPVPEFGLEEYGSDAKSWAKEFLAGKPSPFIGIHPGCSPLKNHTCRRWPAIKYGQLAKELLQMGMTPLVFLGPDEIDLKPEILKQDPAIPIVSGGNIRQVAALIKCCQVCVCSDSSLGHLAAACKVPTVSILGPTNPDYIRPWNVPYRVVSRDLPCSPCFEYSRHSLVCKKGLNYACVREISVTDVKEAVLSLLQETASEG